jgi:hypothetical protein
VPQRAVGRRLRDPAQRHRLSRGPAAELADGDKAGDVRAAFGPVERIMFRMLGIRRFLLLHRVLVPEPPGGEDVGV